MGADRIGDVDFATDAPPEDTIRVLKDAGFKAIPIGEKFGTITTIVNRITVEITTFRVGEVYEDGSRHPTVEFGSDLPADLSRRDLSINAMAMDATGEIHDPFNGREAIANQTLEVPGGGYDNTISILRDDPLRLLRVARFAARFGFAPSDDTTAAAKVTAPSLREISRERWKMELDKLLVARHPDVGLRWLFDVGALVVILPETAQVDDAQLADLETAVCQAPSDKLTRWAVLLLAAQPSDNMPDSAARREMVAAVAQRFRFSKQERRTLDVLMGDAIDPATLSKVWPEVQLRRFYCDAPEQAYQRLDVASALAHASDATQSSISQTRAELDAVLAAGDPCPRLPRGLGNTLRTTFSLKGPAIGEAIACIQAAIIDGEVANDADADTYVRYFAAQQ